MAAKKTTPQKDPKGGLTAAGRAHFKKTQGSNLKPGVKKPMSEMTADDMKRKAAGPLVSTVEKASCRPSRIRMVNQRDLR